MRTLAPPLARALFAVGALAAPALWLTGVAASQRVEESAESAREWASLVAIVRIKEARSLAVPKGPCGTTYTAEVQSTEKGVARVGDVLAFGFLGTLDQGKVYRIYLSPDTSEDAWIAYASAGRSDHEITEYMRACRRIHPSKAFFVRSERLGRFGS